MALMALVGYVAADTPVSAPMIGGGMDQLYQAIENNTVQSQITEKKVEDLYGKIQETMSNWTGTIIIANSLFMILIYSILAFISKRRELQKRKKHEELIKTLETEAEIKAKRNIDILQEINIKTEFLLSKLAVLGPIETPKETKPKKTVYYFCFLLGVLITLIFKIRWGA